MGGAVPDMVHGTDQRCSISVTPVEVFRRYLLEVSLKAAGRRPQHIFSVFGGHEQSHLVKEERRREGKPPDQRGAGPGRP